MKRLVVYRVDENVADKFEQLNSILGANDYDIIQKLMYDYIENSKYKMIDEIYDDFMNDEK